MKLSDKTVLVTGGNRGIGLEITRQLLAKGARVVVVGRDRRTLDAVVTDTESAVTAVDADLTDRSSVDALISKMRVEHPEIAILINNAGIQTEMDLFAAEPAGWIAEARNEIAVNLEAAISLSIGLLPTLKQHAEAAIVNVTSALAIAPKQASPVYCATKAGLRSFTQALRYQCEGNAPHIVVSEILMALVDTDMTRGRGSGKITAADAARTIVGGLENGKSEVWVSKARLLRIVNGMSPTLAKRILR